MSALEGLEKKLKKVFMSMSNPQDLVICEIKNKIGILTINRESKYNALNSELLTALKNQLVKLRSLPKAELYGLILTGAGEKAFIAGADIAELANLSPHDALLLSCLGQEVSQLIENFNRPIIAAINGHALGGGLEMALSCDFMYATQNAQFGLPETKLGLIPGFGGTKRLSQILGLSRSKEMVYSGRIIKSEEAFSMGLILKVFETKAQMIDASAQWITDVSKNSLIAISTVKKVMQEGLFADTSFALKNEAEYFSQLFATPDMLEGTVAFLGKRQAHFKHES